MSDAPRHQDELIRSRQRSGARATAWILAAFIVLVFCITLAKIAVNR